ncbi:MAG: adenosylmethionine--8-amino-7-oxononanoate transaminase [Phycisphaerae bacterium]|nr:adenosylmethionine--8-amino-7-oxononanoate transaminase [Gemmatimonadaceae bacterium]
MNRLDDLLPDDNDGGDLTLGETQRLLLQDSAHLWHPYTQHMGAPLPVPIARASGAWLYDTNGRAILDAISSWWVTTHGHSQPEIANAIAEQARTLDHVMFAGFTHAPATELAAELVTRLPRGLSRVFLSDNGSTAVEVAIKMSLQSYVNAGKPRRLIAALDNAYHGDTFGAMAAGARGLFSAPYEPLLFEVARLPDPTEGDTVGALTALIAERGAELAAVIVEPLLLGAGGMHIYDERVLQAIRQMTEDAGVHLIADEVLTGFGRTGPLFACERADIAPDLMCLSKGLTGGAMALGATATTEAIYDAFLSPDRRHTFFHGHSYTANPIACSAALAALLLYDDESEDNRIRIEVAHAHHLAAFQKHPGVKNTRQIGTVAVIELLATAGYLSEIGRDLAAFALEQGVLLRPLGNVVYCLPPYCITDSELDRVYDVIRKFLDGARATGLAQELLRG